MQENGNISIIYCKTEDQTADMFGKSFSFREFEFPSKKLGIGSPQGKEEF